MGSVSAAAPATRRLAVPSLSSSGSIGSGSSGGGLRQRRPPAHPAAPCPPTRPPTPTLPAHPPAPARQTLGASGVSLISGGATRYMMSGVTSRPSAAGTTAALNQVSQAEGTAAPTSTASFMHSRFCAAAVRNIALLLTLPCSCVCTRYAPSFLREGSSGKGRRSRGGLERQ